MSKVCRVCERVEGVSAIEVFGKIRGVECGCSGCIGIEHHPKFKLIDALLFWPPALTTWAIMIAVIVL